jgi:hypothetical protein
VEYGPTPVQGNPFARSSSFRNFGTQRFEKLFDVRPLNVGTDRFLEYRLEDSLMLPFHSIRIPLNGITFQVAGRVFGCRYCFNARTGVRDGRPGWPPQRPTFASAFSACRFQTRPFSDSGAIHPR